jgi:hypothetical protein
MKIELLYMRDCPNHLPTVETITAVLRERGFPADITEIEIDSADQAIRFAFPGSPTVRIDGRDVEPDVVLPMHFGLSCRSYVVNGRRQGVPDREWIRQAIDNKGEQS